MIHHQAPPREQRLPVLCWLPAIVGLFLGLPAFSSAQPSSEAKIRFDIPADTANKSLKQYAIQARREVSFGSDTAAQVRTNAVKGEFTAREGITRLLAGTSLVVVEDERTGAFTVSRDPNGVGAALSSGRPGNLHLSIV